MSASGKLAVAASIVFTTSIITYVTYSQRAERERMHKGVKEYIEENYIKPNNVTQPDKSTEQKNNR